MGNLTNERLSMYHFIIKATSFFNLFFFSYFPDVLIVMLTSNVERTAGTVVLCGCNVCLLFGRICCMAVNFTISVCIVHASFIGCKFHSMKILRAFLQKTGGAVFELNYLRNDATFQPSQYWHYCC